ncbi:hypothetical protein EIP86_010511 [Pleurotus ostreatoroseus]|nr:hypothetical protein EIP86_010511 [Pleurotus ostreatoroseus]
MAVLGLPPIPSELKSVGPYLQRAEEVKSQDPVISYWCAYYAAQLGIGLKLKDHASRAFLLDLLELLERMKTEIGQNDAIEDDAASAAYVENFALRVFSAADNEDRRGNANRGTAKKFLAAANFLEVLSTFESASSSPEATTTINVSEKIRYAKWKAADIAKAIREGRKPTPGGIDEPQPEEQPIVPDDGAMTAGEVAPSAPTDGTEGQIQTQGGSGASAWVSPELEGRVDEYDQDVARIANEGEGKSLHFAPSAPPSEDTKLYVPPAIPSAPTDHPGEKASEDEEPGMHSQHGIHDLSQPPELPSTPSFILPSVPSAPSPSQPSAQLPPPPSAPYFPPSSPSPPPSAPQPPPSLPPPPSQPPKLSAPPPTFSRPTPRTAAPPPPPADPEPEPVLAPATVARIQKHCKFAISALDYEDVDTARKELRQALQMLGG